MARGPEDKFPDGVPDDYRSARRTFVAACEAAGADVIARVHPGRGPDGGPLFMDTAAFGPRDAGATLLVIAAGTEMAALAPLLGAGIAGRLPPGGRLVLLHALDPWAAAWRTPGPDPDWPLRMLRAMAVEDLSRAHAVRVLNFAADIADDEMLADALRRCLPGAAVTMLSLPGGQDRAFAGIPAQIAAAVAAL